jgi:hypothetical protein
MSIAAADRKADGSQSKPPSLALHTGEAYAIVDDQVTACVLAEREVDTKTYVPESDHDREL